MNSHISQLCLLGTSERGRRQRVALDAESWVEHTSQWLAAPAELMSTLLEQAPWEQRSRWMYDRTVKEPRLTAEYRILAEAEVPRVRLLGTPIGRAYVGSASSRC